VEAPRIPAEYQIIKECYGNAPKFSRGHMTRREDPAWGTSAISQRGSDDSMHVTNATPQMQAFNSPIWLALEDYALQNLATQVPIASIERKAGISFGKLSKVDGFGAEEAVAGVEPPPLLALEQIRFF
jgi:DNA/RNA endonuclease G (NUC1)